MTDEQIIRGCQKNDSKAQKLLYDKHAPKMMGVCLRYTGSTDEAKDLLQDGFIKVFKSISSFRFDGRIEGWIKKVMVNTALENLRKKKLILEKLDEEYSDNQDHQAADLNHNVKDLLRMLQQMPHGYRTVFNLYAIEGYSHNEIADKLEITEGTSKSQYARAKEYLQKLMMAEKV